MTNTTELQAVISEGSGDPHQYYAPLFPKYRYSAGVREVAILAGAHWLVDAIFSHLPYLDSSEDYFSVWELVAMPTDDRPTQFELKAHRGTGDKVPPLRSQIFPASDFPLNNIKFYVSEEAEGKTAILYLPSEH